MILLSAIITLALYVESPLSGLKPWSTRYLVGLLIAVPAVLWPLWQGAQSEIVGVPSQVACTLMTTIKRGVLALIIIAILGGTVATFASLPTTEADNQQQEAIIHDLLKLGATHVFTEYWIGYRLMIQSHEQIICAVPPGLSAPGSNRYYPYYLRVSADAKHAVYLFYVNSPDARTFASKIAHSSMHYRKYVFDGYEAYQPFNQ
jgi:hypothetical protein